MSSGRVAALLAALVAGSAFAVPSPAPASPVFVDADTSLQTENDVDASGTGCNHFLVPLPPQEVPVVENGGAASVHTTVAGSAAGPSADDTASISADATAVVSLGSVGGLPRSLDYTISGQSSLVTQRPVSACFVEGYAEAKLGFRFVLDAPGYFAIDVTSGAHSFAAVDLEDTAAALQANVSGFGRAEHRLRLRAPTGSYVGDLDGWIGSAGSSSDAGSGAAEAHVTFTPFGALTSPATGAGARYVTLPSAASCAQGTLAVAVTHRRKRAAAVRQLRFLLGDRVVMKVRRPRRGAVVHVPLDRASPSQLRVEVILATKHRHPRSSEVSAGYEACS